MVKRKELVDSLADLKKICKQDYYTEESGANAEKKRASAVSCML